MNLKIIYCDHVVFMIEWLSIAKLNYRRVSTWPRIKRQPPKLVYKPSLSFTHIDVYSYVYIQNYIYKNMCIYIYIHIMVYIYTYRCIYIYIFIHTYVPYGCLTWQTRKSLCLLAYSCKIVYTGGWICEIDRWFKYSRLVAMSLMNSHEFAKSARKSRCKLWKNMCCKTGPPLRSLGNKTFNQHQEKKRSWRVPSFLFNKKSMDSIKFLNNNSKIEKSTKLTILSYCR